MQSTVGKRGDYVEIPYFPGRRLGITLYRLRIGKLRLMITPLFKIRELPEYKDEWFYKRWWFVDLPF